MKLLLTTKLAAGDILMLTAAVRDLHKAYPNKYQTDVHTTNKHIWENNPYITKLEWTVKDAECEIPEPNQDFVFCGQKMSYYDNLWHSRDDTTVINPSTKEIITKPSDLRVLHMNYNLINSSNNAPYHFIHGYVQDLERKLNIRIPLTNFKGDIHLSNVEKSWLSQIEEQGCKKDFWIIIAGGKYDFTTKWWDPYRYQDVVDYFKGRITFVQTGEKSHWHQPLSGVIDLIGKTDIRQFIRLMYHASGVLCPVTFGMHLAAAVETKPNKPNSRACVVIAGSREPAHWEAYPNHQYIHNCGSLSCAPTGGCWKSRCQLVGDNDPKDVKDVCEQPVQLYPNLRIPKCMDMITHDMVVRRIESYYEGGAYKYDN